MNTLEDRQHHQSHEVTMKSLTRLWQELADELASWCDTDARRDYETLRRRVEHEGDEFLTLTLPTFGSDFERCLDQGRVTSDQFRGFRKTGGLPRFLSGFLRQVFDPVSGVLLSAPNVDAIFAIRQLSLVFKKIEVECSPDRNAAALNAFERCEEELRAHESQLLPRESEFKRMSRLLFGDVIHVIETEVEDFAIMPKHGPGATADRKMGNAKFLQSEWTERLEEFFPWTDYVLPNVRYWEYSSQVTYLAPERERPVKVTLVPKTLASPRVIAIEPTCMQYMQQGLKDSLVPKLEHRFPGNSYIGFEDQELNRSMARKGSMNGSLATLDLSEASDRVANTLVKWLFADSPTVSGAVQATRSTRADLGDGRVIDLTKFASMGSALCFPVEAMVFLTIVFLGIEQSLGTRMTPGLVKGLKGQVRVYGDDIVVPADAVEGVVSALEAYGLKINHKKSFWTGKFRESCGGDYFDGEDVTPIRLKQLLPTSPRDAKQAMHLSTFGNALHKRGLWKTAAWVSEYLESVLKTYPVVPWDSSAVGSHSFCSGNTGRLRWNRTLHRFEVKAYVPDIVIPDNEIADVWALRKALTGDWSDPADREHLERSGRPYVVNIKRRWVPA